MVTATQLGAMKITEVLERWPAAADVFHSHDMACVGCAVAPFYTIADAAEVYGLPPDGFIGELMRAIEQIGASDEREQSGLYPDSESGRPIA